MFTSEPSLPERIERIFRDTKIVDPHTHIRCDQPTAPDLASLMSYHWLQTELNSVGQQTLRAAQLDVRWFVNAHLGAHVKWSRNWVKGLQQVPSAGLLSPNSDVYNQTDVSVIWKLAKKDNSQVQIGVRNLSDSRFLYTDPDPLSPRFSIGRLVYGTLNFSW